MKKQTYLKIAVVASLTFLSACGERKEDSNSNDKLQAEQAREINIEDKEKQVEVNLHETPVKMETGKIPDNLFTVDNLNYILQVTDYEMFDEGGYDFMWNNPISFRPEGWGTDFIYAQVDFTKGEVTETAFVIFYPQVDEVLDGKGTISSKVFQTIAVEDHPCGMCKMESITAEYAKNGEALGLKGVFVDRLDDSKKTIKYMDYNFAEMNIFWLSPEIYKDIMNMTDDSNGATTEFDKTKYTKSEIVGVWFQPHFAVRSFDFKKNNDVVFYSGKLVNDEEEFFNGKWSFTSDEQTAINIVFEKGKTTGLELPLQLSGGLKKSSYILTNNKEHFAKTYDDK